jgi:hypothetical protein
MHASHLEPGYKFGRQGYGTPFQGLLPEEGRPDVDLAGMQGRLVSLPVAAVGLLALLGRVGRRLVVLLPWRKEKEEVACNSLVVLCWSRCCRLVRV